MIQNLFAIKRGFIILLFAILLYPLNADKTAVLEAETAVATTTVTYTPATTNFANPERGLYHYIETRASAPNTYNLTTLQNYRLNEDITLLYCINYIDDFVSTPLSASYLTHLQTNLNTVRNAGLKCILRFAYTDDWNNETPPYGDATKAQILTHLGQLEPILQANSDIITLMQAGFIGVWGEWYYTQHFVDDPALPWVVSPTQWQNRHDVLSRMLEILPPSRTTAVRYAHAKQNMLNITQPLTPTTAYDGSEVARIGYHNDCFLASDTDFGTWLDASAKAYMAADTQFLAMGGETCFVNPPRSQCPTALIELALFHWSYLNIDYQPDVLQSWRDDGCFDTIEQSLGYRLQLIQGNYSDQVRPGHQFTIDLTLQNVGYAAPYNPRPVQLLARNTSTGAIYAIALPEAPRHWFANDSQRLNYTICVPSNMPPATYALLLNLPDRDASLRTQAAYAILFANTTGVQETATGYNDLQHTLTVDVEAPATPCSTPYQLTPFSGSTNTPILSISQSGHNLPLSWIDNPANCHYDMYNSETPYFATAPNTLLDDTLLARTTNYTAVLPTTTPIFYQLQATNCDGSQTAVSNEVGAFSYPLHTS